MITPVKSWNEFKRRWGGLHNFLMEGEVAPFHYEMPPIERVVEEVRKDPHVIFRSGVKQDEFDLTDIGAEMKALPVGEVLKRRFVMAHFALTPHLTSDGKVFEGLEQQWVEPWREVLRGHGFTWDQLFPILFVSGPHSASNYHMDYSHQLAWQRHGVKHFHGLRDPDHWTTREQRVTFSLKHSVKPAGIGAADVYTIVQGPGSVLWNAVTTPHWVETFDEPAATLTLVHGGLKLNGEYCPHESEFREHRAEQERLQGAKPQAAGNY